MPRRITKQARDELPGFFRTLAAQFDQLNNSISFLVNKHLITTLGAILGLGLAIDVRTFCRIYAVAPELLSDHADSLKPRRFPAVLAALSVVPPAAV